MIPDSAIHFNLSTKTRDGDFIELLYRDFTDVVLVEIIRIMIINGLVIRGIIHFDNVVMALPYLNDTCILFNKPLDHEIPYMHGVLDEICKDLKDKGILKEIEVACLFVK